MIKIIVAHSANRVIGNKGKIPWDYPEDMAHFKRTTTGHSVVMGRKTWESIGSKPLPKRTNYIITSEPDKIPLLPNTVLPVSFDDMITIYKCNWPQGKDLFVIGGQQIYQAFLDAGLVDKIIATTIHHDVDGDTFFPELNREIWCLKEINAFHKDFHISTFCKRADYYVPENIKKLSENLCPEKLLNKS